MAREYVIDGSRAVSLEDFFEEVGRVLVPREDWGRNLDAFNDVLREGFEAARERYDVRWANSAASREHLGHGETARQLAMRLKRCHPSDRPAVARELEDARAGRGPTAFDWVVDVMRHREADGDLRLILE